MDDSPTIEPFGFFTLESLRAGWYLTWRLLVRVAIGTAAAGVAAGVLVALRQRELAAAVVSLGVVAAMVWAAIVMPRVIIRWAEQWYGATLTGRVRIWWGVTWRSWLAALVAAVICTPPEFVALSLMTAFPGSLLGGVGRLLSLALGVVNFGVAVVASGWAMSKVAVQQIATGEAGTPDLAPPVEARAAVEPDSLEPLVVGAPLLPARAPEPAIATAAVAAPVAVTVPAVAVTAPLERPVPPPSAPRAPSAGERRQCPKCSLYETERGSVIGWYCRVCGWRESKSR